MSGFAFIILLTAFAVIAYWYASNVERAGEARQGWFAIKEDGDILSARRVPSAGSAQAVADKVRARVSDREE